MPNISCLIESTHESFYASFEIIQKYYDTIKIASRMEYDTEIYYFECPTIENLHIIKKELWKHIHNYVAHLFALYIADGTYPKEWDSDLCIEKVELDSDQTDIKLSSNLVEQVKNFLKVIQWKCPSYFTVYIKNLSREVAEKEIIDKLITEHNKKYTITYTDWDKQQLYTVYTFYQYLREFEEKFEKGLTVTEIREIAENLQNRFIHCTTFREPIDLNPYELMELIKILNRYLHKISPAATSICCKQEIEKIIGNEALHNDWQRKNGNSINAISTPMGGQGGYKRRTRHK